MALAGAGIITIVVDVSTRNLTGGGHDDRGLVAIAESVMLVGLVALFAFGVMLRKWRDRHNRRALIGSDPTAIRDVVERRTVSQLERSLDGSIRYFVPVLRRAKTVRTSGCRTSRSPMVWA